MRVLSLVATAWALFLTAACVRSTEGLGPGAITPTRTDGGAVGDAIIDPGVCPAAGCDARVDQMPPVGAELPVGAEPPADAAMPMACASGTHACGAACAPDDDATQCGPTCMKCPAPTGATAICRNGACEFSCTTGRRCVDKCILAGQPCDGQCLPGFSNCRETCVPTATIGVEICDGKDNDCNGAIDDDITPQPCSPACAGARKCVDGKWDPDGCDNIERDPKSCGPACMVCPGPPGGHGNATCTMGVCGIACQPPAKMMGDHCGCRNHAECPPNNVCQPDGGCRFQVPVIRVVSGFYGKKTCDGKPFVASPPGTTFDRTAHLAKQCNGQVACPYKVDHTVIGDPYVGCGKDYEAIWDCVSGVTITRRMASLPAEATGMIVSLTCN